MQSELLDFISFIANEDLYIEEGQTLGHRKITFGTFSKPLLGFAYRML